MKFSCSRCNTRYSIADERVRGKILKIRCKKCSAVITVRENQPAKRGADKPRPRAGPLPSVGSSANKSASGQSPKRPAAAAANTEAPTTKDEPRPSALSSAFEQAMATQPTADDSLTAPMNLESEWYVAEHGVQSGPFGLDQACDWVAGKPMGAELYCWTDGFDDWRPVSAVAQFREVVRRPARGFLDPGSMSGPPGPAMISPGLVPDAPGLDLEIGEVSRVVRLPMMQPPPSQAGDALPGVGRAPAGPPATHPGALGPNRVGYGTGSAAALRQTGGLAALNSTGSMPSLQKRHGNLFWVLVGLGGAGVLTVGGILLYMAFGSGDESTTLRRSRTADNTLGYTISRDGRRIVKSPVGDDPDDTGPAKGTRKTGRIVRKTGTRPVGKGITEVDLGGGSGGTQEVGPEDVEDRYRKSSYMINRCWERALKRDPFLKEKLSKAVITVNVDLRGRATAKVPISNAQLRACLQSLVQGWRFGKPKESFRTSISVVFK